MVGHGLGGEFEYAAVYLVEDLDGYWSYLGHPAHLRSELAGIELTEKFEAVDVSDSDDPELAAKIAALRVRNFQEHPELAAVIAKAGSFSAAGGGAGAVPAGIDQNAPVIARHETEIIAPLGAVWRLHTAVDEWPSWHQEVTAARLDGPFAPGSSFEWTSYGFTVTSTIYAVEETADRARVLWGGTAGGVTGIHEWVFTRTPGGTRVLTQESFSGPTVEADVATMQGMLGSLTAWLQRLSSAAASAGTGDA